MNCCDIGLFLGALLEIAIAISGVLSEANALSEANLAIAIGAGERSEEWKTNKAPIGTFLRATRRRRTRSEGRAKA